MYFNIVVSCKYDPATWIFRLEIQLPTEMLFYQKWLCRFISIVKQSMNTLMFYKKGTKKYLVNILTYMVVLQVTIRLKTLEWHVF